MRRSFSTDVLSYCCFCDGEKTTLYREAVQKGVGKLWHGLKLKARERLKAPTESDPTVVRTEFYTYMHCLPRFWRTRVCFCCYNFRPDDHRKPYIFLHFPSYSFLYYFACVGCPLPPFLPAYRKLGWSGFSRHNVRISGLRLSPLLSCARSTFRRFEA